jgi:hypothetical protein
MGKFIKSTRGVVLEGEGKDGGSPSRGQRRESYQKERGKTEGVHQEGNDEKVIIERETNKRSKGARK